MHQLIDRFVAPTTTDQLSARRQYYMSIGLLAFLGLAVLFLGLEIVSNLQGGLGKLFDVSALIWVIVLLVAYLLVRKEKLDQAWHLISITMLIDQAYLSFTDGLDPSRLLFLFLPVLIAGTLLNLRVAGLYWIGGLVIYAAVQFQQSATLTSASLQNVVIGSLFHFLFILIYRRGVQAMLAREQSISAELVEHYEKLEAKVAARTRELNLLNEELQSSETRYRSLVELSPEGVCVLDGRTILFINQTGSRMLGESEPSTFVGQSILDLVVPDIRELVIQHIEAVLNGKTIKRVEGTLVRRDGTRLEVSVTAGPVQFGEKPAIQFVFRDITEWIKTQAELQARRDREKATLDALPDLMFLIDRNLTFLDYRAEHSELLAASPTDFLGRTVADVLPSPTAEQISGAIRRALETSAIVELSYSLLLPSGLSFFEARIAPLPDRSAALILSRDVTSQVNAQNSLAKIEHIYRQAIAAAGGVPYQVDATGIYTFIGKSIETLTGYSASEMTQQVWISLIEEQRLHGSLGRMTLAQAIEAVRSNQVAAWTADVRIRTRSGDTRWVSDTSVELRNEEGQSVGSIGFLLDITERKQIEMALQENEILFRTLFEESPEAIFLLDPNVSKGNSLIIDCNRAACEMNGYTREELVGQPISILNVQEHDLAEYLDSIRLSGSLHRDVLHRRKDGTIFPIEVSTALMSVNGRELLLGFDRDITQRKALEQELRQAKESAETSNQMKSVFLANMSHEIRTPMNAVVGMTSLLLDTNLSDEQLEYIAIIRSSGDHLLEVINDILDFSKIESGKLELESVPFNLRECVETSVELFGGEAARKNLELISVLAADTPDVIVSDSTRLRQILTNLIGNAIKFTDTGEVVVRTVREQTENGTVQLHFSVKDTGIGISPENQERLFTSFSQVDASMTRRYGGSGLGLAISRWICEEMGGRMWVESEVDAGSTFHFTIVVPLPADSAQLSRPDRLPLAGKRLLIVDDNRLALEWAEELAQRSGLVVESAQASSAAVEAVSRGAHFDVGLIDWDVNGESGLALAQTLHQLSGSDPFPLILNVPPGMIDGGTIQRTQAIRAVLYKPLKETDLERVLAEVLLSVPGELPLQTKAPKIAQKLAEELPLQILVAEDNLVNQKVAQRMLAKLGYSVDLAANGVEVLDALQRQPYDLVLMDIQMPEMDGVEATRHIQAEWAEEERPRIVAMTAHAHAEARKLCEEAGMDSYITKPVRIEDLIQMLKHLDTSNHTSNLSTPGVSTDHQPASTKVT